MSRCREEAIALIDEALDCKSRLDPCHCQVVGNEAYECDGCKIKRALMVSRSCVVQGVIELDLLKIRFIGVQEAIEDKLRAALKLGGNGGKNEG